jgi:uncharacterized membrane protein affecting hemolysin expression
MLVAGTSGVKLTSRSHLVKPDRRVLAVAAVTAVVAVAAVHLVLALTDRAQGRMDRFGTAAARALAELAVEPLMRQDRLHLGVIGNRLAETPEINGVASYTSDDQVLASTGDMPGPQYGQPVTIDDSIVGYVRVSLHPPAFAEPERARTVGLLLIAVLLPLLVAAGWTLADAARSGALAAALPLQPRWTHPRRHEEPAAPAAAETLAAEAEPRPDIHHYLLAVNLYNQFTLEPNEREFELSLCAELAESVAEVYQGQVVSLPGVGTLLDLDHSDDDDRPFQVLCAAFVLARLLRDEAPFGHYRLGLNLAVHPADEALPLNDPAVSDAALLSALARDGTLAVSAPYAEALDGRERYSSRALVNPLLDELTTSSAGCYLITELAAPFATLVMQQAEQLKTQRDAISSPSTF